MGFWRSHNSTTTAERINEFQINSASYGEVVPEVLGTTRHLLYPAQKALKNRDQIVKAFKEYGFTYISYFLSGFYPLSQSLI